MKKVFLVFNDSKELDFIYQNLFENGYEVFVSTSLKDAIVFAGQITPDLIVLNTLDSETEIRLFCEKLQNIHILSLLDLQDYLKTSKEHFIVKPVRPKLLLSLIRSLLNNEEINWFPSFQ